MGKTDGFDKAFIAWIAFIILANLVMLGVGVWAVIELVTHFTG